MQKSVFFDGQDVLVEDITNTELTKSVEIARRTLDQAKSFGVIQSDPTGADTKLFPTVTAANVITISPGAAYDGNGEYINWPGAPTTGALTIAFLNTDIGKWIVLRYAAVLDTPIAHPVDGASHNTRNKDSATNRNMDGTYSGSYTQGFTVVLTSSPLTTDVKLGQISATDGLGGATIDVTLGFSFDNTTKRHAFSARVVDIGNKSAVAIHQRDLHTTGIIGGSDPATLSFFINSATPPDSVTVNDLGTDDRVIINGTEIQAIAGTDTVLFDDGTVNAGTYEIYMDENAKLHKNLIAAFPAGFAGLNIKGIQVLEVSPHHATGSFNLVWNFGTKTISWNGAPGISFSTTPLANITGQYRLFRNGDFDQSILIHIDQTTLYTVTTTQTMAVTIGTRVDRQENFVVGTVFWGGTVDGHLGYGTGGTPGSEWDMRTFGNLGVKDVADELMAGVIQLQLAETRSSGVVRGGQVIAGTGLQVILGEGVWYLHGKRVPIPKTTLSSLTASSTFFVYVADDASVSIVVPPADQLAQDFEFKPQPNSLKIASVTTGVSTVSSITNLAPNIGDLDARLASTSGASLIGNAAGGVRTATNVAGQLSQLDNATAKLEIRNVFTTDLAGVTIPNTTVFNGLVLPRKILWSAERQTGVNVDTGSFWLVDGTDHSTGWVNNAFWDGTHWDYLALGPQNAQRVKLRAGVAITAPLPGLVIQQYEGATGWIDSAWVTRAIISATPNGSGAGNGPGVDWPFAIYPQGIGKAILNWDHTPGGSTTATQINCTGHFAPSGPTTARVLMDFGFTFPDTNYAVLAFLNSTDTVEGDWVHITSKDVNGLSFEVLPTGGGAYDLDATHRSISVVVYKE